MNDEYNDASRQYSCSFSKESLLPSLKYLSATTAIFPIKPRGLSLPRCDFLHHAMTRSLILDFKKKHTRNDVLLTMRCLLQAAAYHIGHCQPDMLITDYIYFAQCAIDLNNCDIFHIAQNNHLFRRTPGWIYDNVAPVYSVIHRDCMFPVESPLFKFLYEDVFLYVESEQPVINTTCELNLERCLSINRNQYGTSISDHTAFMASAPIIDPYEINEAAMSLADLTIQLYKRSSLHINGKFLTSIMFYGNSLFLCPEYVPLLEEYTNLEHFDITQHEHVDWDPTDGPETQPRATFFVKFIEKFVQDPTFLPNLKLLQLSGFYIPNAELLEFLRAAGKRRWLRVIGLYNSNPSALGLLLDTQSYTDPEYVKQRKERHTQLRNAGVDVNTRFAIGCEATTSNLIVALVDNVHRPKMASNIFGDLYDRIASSGDLPSKHELSVILGACRQQCLHNIKVNLSVTCVLYVILRKSERRMLFDHEMDSSQLAECVHLLWRLSEGTYRRMFRMSYLEPTSVTVITYKDPRFNATEFIRTARNALEAMENAILAVALEFVLTSFPSLFPALFTMALHLLDLSLRFKEPNGQGHVNYPRRAHDDNSLLLPPEFAFRGASMKLKSGSISSAAMIYNYIASNLRHVDLKECILVTDGYLLTQTVKLAERLYFKSLDSLNLSALAIRLKTLNGATDPDLDDALISFNDDIALRLLVCGIWNVTDENDFTSKLFCNQAQGLFIYRALLQKSTEFLHKAEILKNTYRESDSRIIAVLTNAISVVQGLDNKLCGLLNNVAETPSPRTAILDPVFLNPDVNSVYVNEFETLLSRLLRETACAPSPRSERPYLTEKELDSLLPESLATWLTLRVAFHTSRSVDPSIDADTLSVSYFASGTVANCLLDSQLDIVMRKQPIIEVATKLDEFLALNVERYPPVGADIVRYRSMLPFLNLVASGFFWNCGEQPFSGGGGDASSTCDPSTLKVLRGPFVWAVWALRHLIVQRSARLEVPTTEYERLCCETLTVPWCWRLENALATVHQAPISLESTKNRTVVKISLKQIFLAVRIKIDTHKSFIHDVHYRETRNRFDQMISQIFKEEVFS